MQRFFTSSLGPYLRSRSVWLTLASLMALGLLSYALGAQAAPESPLAQRVAKSGAESYWLSYEIETNRELGFTCCLDRDHFSRRGLGSARPGRCRPDASNHSWSTWHDDDFGGGDLKGADRLRVLLGVKQGMGSSKSTSLLSQSDPHAGQPGHDRADSSDQRDAESRRPPSRAFLARKLQRSSSPRFVGGCPALSS